MRFRIRGIKTTLEFPTLKIALSRRFPLTPTRFPPVGFRCQTVNSGRFSWARRSRPLVRNCDRRFSPVILCLRTAPSRSFSSSNGCTSAPVTSGSTCLFPCVPVSSRKKSFKLSRGLYLSYRMPQPTQSTSRGPLHASRLQTCLPVQSHPLRTLIFRFLNFGILGFFGFRDFPTTTHCTV